MFFKTYYTTGYISFISSFIFYAINNHMYLVKDTDKCNSLREKAKENSKSFNTSLIEKEKRKLIIIMNYLYMKILILII